MKKDKLQKISLDYDDYLKWDELNSGIIRLYEDIEENCVETKLRELAYIEKAKINKIKIYISSSGGSVYHTIALYDEIKDLPNKGIKTEAIVEGYAASAAAMILLQAFQVRKSRENARFLFHEIRKVRFYEIETNSAAKDNLEEMNALNKIIIKIISNRSGNSEKKVRSLFERKEKWFSAEEAKKLNLIDVIL